MEERRIEFGFEWKRWFDIKRRDLGDIVFKGANSTEPLATFDKTRDYLFPISQMTIDVYPSLDNPEPMEYSTSPPMEHPEINGERENIDVRQKNNGSQNK